MRLVARLRFLFALWLGKFVFFAARISGKKGTTLPGALAIKLCPELITYLARQLPNGAILVTGTNGKTTTSNMLAAILKKTGAKITFNEAGANLITGITTAFLNSATWLGRIYTDMALLEVDEATVGKVAPLVKPHTMVITNFFRDQLDRYGELDKTVALVKNTVQAYLPQTKLVLNADDPLVAQIGVGREGIVYYGVAPSEYSTTESSEAREAKYCSFCRHTYEYEIYHYGQLGIYRCPNCNFRRPKPQVSAENIKIHGFKGISFGLGDMEISLRQQGFYNIYNALASVATALSMGINKDLIKDALEQFAPQAGRMEQFAYGIHEITLSLVKNPTGFNEVIRAMVHSDKQLGLLIAINDNAADGRDISWLWDVDFEKLEHKLAWVICSGIRAEDMAVRLKYAGVDPEKLITIKDLSLAFDKMLDKVEGDLGFYVLPTYTALFSMHELMSTLRRTAYAS